MRDPPRYPLSYYAKSARLSDATDAGGLMVAEPGSYFVLLNVFRLDVAADDPRESSIFI